MKITLSGGSNIETVIQLFLPNTAVDVISNEYDNDLKQILYIYIQRNQSSETSIES